LYHNKNILYKDFYTDFLHFESVGSIVNDLEKQIQEYLDTDLGIKFAEYNGEKCLYEEFIYLSCLDNIDAIYAECKKYLSNIFNDVLRDDIIKFNYNMITGLHAQKQFELNYDLPTYYKKLITLPPNVQCTDSIPAKELSLDIKDRRIGVNKVINFDDIKTTNGIKRAILKNSNFRHRTSYFPSVFFG